MESPRPNASAVAELLVAHPVLRGIVRARDVRHASPMTSTFPRARRIHVLLDTLMGERHLRSPLLSVLTDELAAAPGLADAASAASLLALDAPQQMVEDVFVSRVRALAELVRGRSPQE